MTSTSYEAVDQFEKTIAEYAGAPYGIAVDSCTNALFLCCKYRKVNIVKIPSHTYPGVANSIIHSGGKIIFKNKEWKGVYSLQPHNIIDGALRFKKAMYGGKGQFHCLSFHSKKHLPIGRGGMILTDSNKAYEWFKRARFDGRNQCPLNEDTLDMEGWNCYMTPEQAARGLMLFETIKDKNLPDIDSQKQNYPDLSKIKTYNER